MRPRPRSPLARDAIPATEAPAVAALPGGPLTYTLRHSARARGLRVVIHPERGVVVTVPASRSGRTLGERRAEEFLGQREPWIRRHLARHAVVRAELAARGGARDGGAIRLEGRVVPIRTVPAVVGTRRSTVARFEDELVIHRANADARSDEAVVEAWLRDVAREKIDDAVDRHAAALGVTPLRITIRDPRTRWGSASKAGRLSLSWRLVLAPNEALETVVIHELAHLRYFGHGPRFWALVASRRPDHRTWRRWLHDHATELHGALG